MTTRKLHSQGGFTLIEVLLVSTLFVLVLGVTLSAATGFDSTTRRNTKLNEQIDSARAGLDEMNRQLRNLAQRVDKPVIDVATSTDFIFQTSDPARTWVRYCLQPNTGPNGTARLFSAQNAAALAVSDQMRSACPGTGWDSQRLVADGVANMFGGRRVFTYNCPPERVGCPATAADFPLIKSVSSQLYIDNDPASRPAENLVSTAVFLRNQNEDPTARFSWKPTASRQVTLNGAASSDPEGRTLRFYWYAGTAPTFTCAAGPPATPTHLTGVLVTYKFPDSAGAAGSSVPFTLVVCDPGDLQARYSESVTIPS